MSDVTVAPPKMISGVAVAGSVGDGVPADNEYDAILCGALHEEVQGCAGGNSENVPGMCETLLMCPGAKRWLRKYPTWRCVEGNNAHEPLRLAARSDPRGIKRSFNSCCETKPARHVRVMELAAANRTSHSSQRGKPLVCSCRTRSVVSVPLASECLAWRGLISAFRLNNMKCR